MKTLSSQTFSPNLPQPLRFHLRQLNFTLPALGNNMFLTGARFATLVTTFSASKLACEALTDMPTSLSTGDSAPIFVHGILSIHFFSYCWICHWGAVWSSTKRAEGMRIRCSAWICYQLRSRRSR
jgi:hypothetical protein